MLIGEPVRTKNFMENALGIWETIVEMNKDLSGLKKASFLDKPVFKTLIDLADKKLMENHITRQGVKVKVEEGYDQLEINRIKSESPPIKLEISNEENSKLGIFQKRGIIDDIRRIERNVLFINAVFYASDNFYIQENLEVMRFGDNSGTFYTIRGNNNIETMNEYGEILFYYNKDKFYFNPVLAHILNIYLFNEVPEGTIDFIKALKKIQEKIVKNSVKAKPIQNLGESLFLKLQKEEKLGVTDLNTDKSIFSMEERYHICLDCCLFDCYDAKYGKDEAFIDEEKNIMLSKDKLSIDSFYGASPSFELTYGIAQARDMTLVMESKESFEILNKMILKVEVAGNAHSLEFFDRVETEFTRAWNTLKKINEAVKSLN
jgi:hypothetical protein